MTPPCRHRFLTFLTMSLLLSFTANAHASDKSVQKTIKTVLTSIRYEKDSLASRKIDFDKMAELAMGDHWKSVGPDDRQRLSQGIKTITEKLSFPKARELFKHLDAVLYDAPRVKNNTAHLKTTIVVHRNYKKEEVVIDFVLFKRSDQWKIVDTVILGESTLEGVYEDQIEPLIDEGGVPSVLQALNRKLKTLK